MPSIDVAADAPQSASLPLVPRVAAARRRLSLRTKLLLTMGSLVAAILVVASALDIAAAHSERLEALRLRSALVAEALAAALANPVWEYDEDAGQAALDGILQDPEFVEAVVVDDTGATFARVRQKGLPAIVADALVVAKRPVQIVSPTGELRPLGSVELRFSRQLVASKLRRALLTFLVQLLILVAVVSIGIVLGLRRFTRPIEELTQIMRRRAGGDLSLDVAPAFLARQDEIGAIAQSIELDQQQRRDEARLLEITSDVSAEAHVGTFLRRLEDAGRGLLGAGRCTVFVHDRERDILWSVVGDSEGPRVELRPGQGFAGAAFASGLVVNVEAAANDPRFDPVVDGSSGRVLCVPLSTKSGVRIGVLQAMDRAAPFLERDVLRLRSLAAQAAVALENARLIDELLDGKAYTDSILSSLSDAVVSLDASHRLATVNAAAARLFGWREEEVRGRTLRELLPDPENDYEIGIVERVATTGVADGADDTDLMLPDGRLLTVNMNAVPLANAKGGAMGSLFVVEDITSEKRVRGTMARYLPKKVVDQLLEGHRAALGGTAQTVTALFSDIRSFTTISEEIGARATVAMLNEYFSEMLDVLDQHNGVLDKFIGDAVMAIFGVPFEGERDADNALAAANDMISSLDRLNVVRAGRDQPPIAIGVGLNTGEAVAGNIGSPKRMSYTVIGDSVNLASRLEGATKAYGASILLSAFTYEALKDRSYVREVDVLRVKGKNRPVAVYESYAYRPDRDSEAVRRAMELSAEGLRRFQARRWTEARAAFEELRAIAPKDQLARVYLERLATYAASPPPDDWDGVWVMTSK